jgi:ApbE superfamily uncharacterized protein (UPF0280 family)
MKKHLIKYHYKYKETTGTIISDIKKAVKVAEQALLDNRKEIEKYIQKNPLFLNSLKPIKIDKAPIVAKKMCEATEKAEVGPMAAIAGVLADLAVDAMIVSGAQVAVVEDGGEASAISNTSIDIGLLAGSNTLSKRLGFRLEKFPIGLATSSGKYSHALSFGEADAVTIFAETAGLADAVATSVGNIIKGNNKNKAIKQGLKKGMSIKGVKGVFIIFDDKVGQAGKIPRLISISE